MNNGKDNSAEEREQEKNKAATEKMERNDEDQNKKVQQKQNELTQSVNPHEDDASLLNNHEDGQSNDSFTIEEKNRRKQEAERDQDFGSEQIK
jgi:hypothetical protein